MKEYRIKITVRNNLLLSAIEAAGYKSQSEFARAAELSPVAVNELVAMRRAPIGSTGEFGDTAKTIMEVLGACPSDLWTTEQLNAELGRNTREFEADGSEMLRIGDGVGRYEIESPEQSLYQKEVAALLGQTLKTLRPRFEKILQLRHGESEQTAEQMADQFEVSKGRIHQCESQALRMMRHPDRAEVLRDHIDGIYQ